ncbi:unnamed protein product [Paramecium pentaurelia]|uniref:Uncharacterized protein n=1 Tax=Paramecium pentaurelia TaxID=43138 RepID=A0A8S1YN55_9CILI|nr:unnamed protein product [Paramecium pentaurelia]
MLEISFMGNQQNLRDQKQRSYFQKESQLSRLKKGMWSYRVNLITFIEIQNQIGIQLKMDQPQNPQSSIGHLQKESQRQKIVIVFQYLKNRFLILSDCIKIKVSLLTISLSLERMLNVTIKEFRKKGRKLDLRTLKQDKFFNPR